MPGRMRKLQKADLERIGETVKDLRTETETLPHKIKELIGRTVCLYYIIVYEMPLGAELLILKSSLSLRKCLC